MWFRWKELQVRSNYSSFGATTAEALVPAGPWGVAFLGHLVALRPLKRGIASQGTWIVEAGIGG